MKTICTFILISFIHFIGFSQPRPWMPPTDMVLSAVSTGRTTGHIADLVINNQSPTDKQFQIPAMTIPSDGKYQGFLIPEPTNIKIQGNSTATIPIMGYCTEPDLPAPPSGQMFVPIDQWDTGSPLINIIKPIIGQTARLQEAGQFTTPFSNNPGKERESIIQQMVWSYSVPSSYDPCINLLHSLDVRDTDWYTQHFPNVEQGIAQIVDAISKVGQAAGLADFAEPSLPTGTGQVPDALPTSHPHIASTVRVVGTGQTTGHIANISVSNPTKEPINIKIGNGGSFLIPSSGNYQPYVVPSIPVISVQPGKTVTVPVEGYCVDIRRPPVEDGIPMPPWQSWIESAPQSIPEVSIVPQIPEPMNPPGSNIIEVTLPTKMAISLQEATNILQSLPPPAAMRNWNCPDLLTENSIFIPGTDILMPTHINVDDMPGLAAPILLDAINRITQATDKLNEDGVINTPFANNKDKERESIIQQTFWMYSAGLSGQPYSKKDFEDNTLKQFNSTTGKNYQDIPQTPKDKIDKGVDDFWNTFMAVGVEAKILPTPAPVTPMPLKKEIEDAFGGLDKSNIKIHRDTPLPSLGTKASTTGDNVVSKTGINPDPSLLGHEAAHVVQQSITPTKTAPDYLNAQAEESPNEEMERPANTPCDCKEMTFNLVVRGENTDAKKNRNNRIVASGQESLSESEKNKEIILDDWEPGDYYFINFNTFKMKCDCQNAGVANNVECDFYPSKSKKTSPNKGLIQRDSAPDKIEIEFIDPSDNKKKKKKIFEVVKENLNKGQKLEYKYTPHKGEADSFTFCFSAYCASDKCNENENGKSCGEYCITLKFKMRQ